MTFRAKSSQMAAFPVILSNVLILHSKKGGFYENKTSVLFYPQ